MKLKVRLQTTQNVYSSGDTKLEFDKTYNTNEVGILLIGLWDTHPCLVAQDKLHQLCPRVNDFITSYRMSGCKIIIGSSSLIKREKYQKYCAITSQIPYAKFQDFGMHFPPLPIDDSDGGVEVPNPGFDRQAVDLHPSIKLQDGDYMCANPKEIVNYMHHYSLRHLIVVGVHLNMCVLDRPYGIRNLSRYGVELSLMRDLTDPMFNCKKHCTDRATVTKKLLDYIEKYICPTTSSHDLFLYKPGKIVFVDVDQTICTGSYENAWPIEINIAKVNALYDRGFTIVVWTARGCVSGKCYRDLTAQQLHDWGLQYHCLKMGKPEYNYLICDKTINWTHNLENDLVTGCFVPDHLLIQE